MYSALSIPFENPNGSNLSLNDIKFVNAKANAKKTLADQILLWVWKEDAQKFDYETWFLKSATDGWFNYDTTSIGFDDPEGHPDGLLPGTTFWYYAKAKDSVMTMQTSGQVVSENVIWTMTRNSYNFVGCPFPTALKLNDSTQVDWGAAKANNKKTLADQIMLWVDVGDTEQGYGYKTYYLSTTGWKNYDTGVTFQEDYPNGVDVGTGFWYNAKSSTTDTFEVTFKTPVAK